MKTVLFVDKEEGELWNSFRQYDFVLDEYQRRGHFAVCDWHPAGRTVATAVPTLQSILADETDWTAVVVSDLRGRKGPTEDDPHFDNPYDFERNYDKDVNAAVRTSEETPPLVRLTQMLGGIPEKSELVANKWGEFPEEVEQTIAYPRPDDYYEMLESYRLGVPRPQKVICITPRSVDEDLEKAREKDFEVAGGVRAYQRDFWQRNDYAPGTRFVVCDRQMAAKRAQVLDIDEDDLSPEAKEVRRIQEENERRESVEWLQFWVSVLTLLVADLPSDDLKPYRLYRLCVSMDFDGIKRMFDRRYTEWIGARDHVLQQMELESRQLVKDEFEFSDTPNCITNITVDFDLVNETELFSNPAKVGLIRDEPENDQKVWTGQRKRIESALSALLRAPRRALRLASKRFRSQSFLDPEALEYCILNQTEIENLEDELLADEIRLVQTTGRRAFRMKSYDNALDEQSQIVRNQIKKRSVRKLILGALIVSLVAVLIGLVPYFIGLWLGLHEGFGAFVTFAIYVAIMLMVTWATLMWQQRVLRQSYLDFNDWMRSILDVMHAESKRLGERISGYATYRKRWSILERQNHRSDPTKRLRWLGHKDALLQTRIRDARSVLPMERDEETLIRMHELSWSMVSVMLENESFYNVYSSKLVERAFNEGHVNNMTIKVPFEFVRTVDLEPIQIW